MSQQPVDKAKMTASRWVILDFFQGGIWQDTLLFHRGSFASSRLKPDARWRLHTAIPATLEAEGSASGKVSERDKRMRDRSEETSRSG